jgi:hypothetical protein
MAETNKRLGVRQTLIRCLWWAAFVTSLLLILASLPGYELKLRELELSNKFAVIQQAALLLGMLLSVTSAFLCLSLALLVFTKRPGEPMAIFLSFFLLAFGIIFIGPLELFFLYWSPQSMDWALLLQTVVFPIMGLALILVFPNGHFDPRWTRWLLVVSLFLNGILLLALDMEELVRMTTNRAQAAQAVNGALLLFGMANQVYRYRRVYSLTERQQAKWVLIGLAAMLCLGAIVSIPYYYELNLPPGAPQPWWVPLGTLSWWLLLMILPVSLTIVVLHYRLFDLDVIIHRTLVYSALTATLAVIFFSGVVLLQQVIGRITGTQDSPVAIVISTLLIAALFNPLRNRIQHDIDRRFFRGKYDAQKTLEAFSAQIREDVQLEQLTDHLLTVVEDTMQPESVSLWLKQTASKRFSSTFTGLGERTP